MRIRTFLSCLLIAAAQISGAQATQVSMQGKTTADMQLIQDATTNLITLGKSRYNCAAPSLIESEVLPSTYASDTHQTLPSSGRTTIYEKWDVTYCGQVESLLMIFMSQPKGGVTFGIQPFPGYGNAKPPSAPPSQ